MNDKHRIYARHSGVKMADRLSIPLIKHCVRTTLQMENIDTFCEVVVLITDDAGIRKLNREFRGIDEPTDVLSFPMQEFSAPGELKSGHCAPLPDDELLALGDIVISAERAKAQAYGYGQTIRRETAYLTVHSALHLLGYYHIDEAEDKRLMRGREKKILEQLAIND